MNTDVHTRFFPCAQILPARPVQVRFLFLAAFAGLAICLSGCGEKIVTIRNSQQFEQVVLKSDKPVLVHFSKAGCTQCAMFSSIQERLAADYKGRVEFADYQLMNLFFKVTDPQLRDRYEVAIYPTVVLFVNGVPTRKWAMHYEIRDYRKALDQALAASSQPSTGAASSRTASEP